MTQILEIREKLESVLLHTGREDFVFRPQNGLDGLLNIHKALIKKVLNDEQKIKYLLYSPIYYATSTPFRTKSKPSSCALLVTDDKFIITKNYHTAKVFPQIYVVDFEDILNLELGWAGLLGWLRIEFVLGGSLKEVSVIYGITSGIRHFSNLAKVYLNRLDGYFNDRNNKVFIKERLPFYFADMNIFLKIEKNPVWIKKKRFLGIREMPLSPKQTIFAEKRGFIIAEEKKDSILGARNFLFIAYSSISDFRINDFVISGDLFSKMIIYLSKNLYPYRIIFNKTNQLKEVILLEDLFKKILNNKKRPSYEKV